METSAQTTWPSQTVVGAWEQQDLFYPLQSTPSQKLNDCGCSHNDTGSDHPAGWVNPDEAYDRGISDCDGRYPVAAKNNGRIGEVKKWKDCKAATATHREEIITNNAKLIARAASDASINKTIEQISGPNTASGASGGIDATTITYVGGGIVLLLIAFFGYKWYVNRQAAQSAPTA